MFNFQESLLLWIPADSESEAESTELNKSVTAANGAVIDFCDGIISLDDTLQCIEYYGADVDEYLEDLGETVRIFGC